MFRFKRLILITLVLLVIASVRPATADSNPPRPQGEVPQSVLTARLACDPDGVQESGAVYRICMPIFPPWNSDLVVFAHGYVSPTEPVGIPEDQMTLPGGITLASIANSLGYPLPPPATVSTAWQCLRESLTCWTWWTSSPPRRLRPARST